MKSNSVAELLFLKGRISEEAKNTTQAIVQYNLAIEDIKKYNPKTLTFSLDRVQWLKAWILYKDKKYTEAEMAFAKDEIPVGAIIVIDNKVIARGHNLTEMLNDVTAHAEMQAITAAANYLGGKYLTGCTLYVTVEPCQMCAGALYWSQISKIVFGATDENRGFTKMGTQLHPKTTVVSGVLANEASELMKVFFAKKRK